MVPPVLVTVLPETNVEMLGLSKLVAVEPAAPMPELKEFPFAVVNPRAFDTDDNEMLPAAVTPELAIDASRVGVTVAVAVEPAAANENTPMLTDVVWTSAVASDVSCTSSV